ncbi:MAG: ABC transporter permease subunit [Streptosporangiales bacterium]|nr:ABC transporter permease subunit [Streptosporangiales bacterium]
MTSTGRRVELRWLALLAPAVLVLVALFGYPVLAIGWRAFSDPELGLGNFTQLWDDPTTLRVLARTIGTALVVTVGTLVLAYPYAYLMTVVGPRARGVLVALVLLPFWTSLMARNFAWIVVLQDGGPLVMFTSAIGLTDRALLGTAAGVALGMVQVLLPYMVLPLYSTMRGIDRRLLDAGGSLGAARVTCFRRIYLPLSLPGILAGSTLVFVLSLGFYVTPRLLGSPKESLIAQVIGTKVEKLLDFGGAGALSLVLLAVTAVLLLVVGRLVRPTAMLRGEERP